MNLRDQALAAEAVAAGLDLAPHPEGGFYRETFRDGDPVGRGAATAILFLLPQGVISHWHRVDALEIWVWQAGAPLLLEIAAPDAAAVADRLGPDLSAGERLQQTVPVQHWQRAQSLGSWSLVSCIVAPAFQFSGFVMAPPGWQPQSA
ncbi:cupin domain-containing protein [Acidisoma sp.]|uniref:cupin domain-containing protein n=1 Tax=Acidisoma sp. TaxID=1872115 RepID=UPI003B001EB3